MQDSKSDPLLVEEKSPSAQTRSGQDVPFTLLQSDEHGDPFAVYNARTVQDSNERNTRKLSDEAILTNNAKEAVEKVK